LAALLAGPGERPTPSLLTLTDVVGGIVCAEGVLAGLLTRLRSGAAQRVDTSLLSAACLLGGGSARQGRHARRTWPPAGVPLREELSALAADQRFARALRREACVLVETPWEFIR
jgi:crotonobetainyl-CoA:carnitine CoA-transferase CaiB-like acyl-CoA transferase